MYINSFFILVPKKSNYKISEGICKYDNSIYEINYNSKKEIEICITELKEEKVIKTKIINILLYKNVYIILTNLYSEVENIKKMLKSKFYIDSEIYSIDNKKYNMLIKRYKINNIYVVKDETLIDIKIKNNKEVYKYMDYIYSMVFLVKKNDISYVINIPKFGLFNTGYESKKDIINIIEEMNLING